MSLSDSRVAQHFIRALQNVSLGEITVTAPDGTEYHAAGTQDGPSARLIVHDWRAIRELATRGDIGFAEGYRDGLWDSPDLEAVIAFGLQNEAALKRYVFGSSLFRMLARLMRLRRPNSLRGSKDNIHAHYDLGNTFYGLWLDESMTYSSALFAGRHTELCTAQHQKYDRIIERLGSGSGDLLEIGCGWGGFAERACAQSNLAVKGITISGAQHTFARQRLGGEAQIALEDYREQQGRYDHLVSIEMFEAVGERYWPIYFGKLKSLLKPGGNAVVQTITIDDRHFADYKRGSDVIREYIFPGGMLPSPAAFKRAAEKAGLSITDRYAFGQDYAKTLNEWLHRFDAKRKDILALGFDERFIRLWRFYLAGCMASFRIGRTDVMQLELRHA